MKKQPSARTVVDDIRPSKVQAQLETLLKDRGFRAKVSDLMERQQASIEIGSAYALSQEEIDGIIKQMGIDREGVTVTNKVDKQLLMGITVKFRDYFVDLSLRGRLQQVFENLQQ